MLVTFILLVISFVLAFVGFISLSEATMGVGFIGLAALAGIYARIFQAEAQQRKLEALLRELDQQAEGRHKRSTTAS